MARWSVLAGVLVTLVGAAFLWVPYLTTPRLVITSTPSPGPTFSRIDVPLAPGHEVCVNHVPFDFRTAQMQFVVASSLPGTAVLDMRASAPGYEGRARVTLPVSAQARPAQGRIKAPAHDVTGTACMRNAGRSPVSVVGTNEATSLGISQTLVDGGPLPPGQGVQLLLLEAHERSLVERVGQVVGRASDFADGLLPYWLALPLVLLLVVGTPFAIFGAFWLALRDQTTG